MTRTLRIGLVFSYSLAYCRGILRGVKSYARTKQDWIFTPVAPEERGLQALAEVRPAGLIAHLYSESLVESLTSLRKPMVNVCGVLPVPSVPRVGIDDDAVSALAARHLLDRGIRHFAFVGHPHQDYSLRRETAFRRCIESAGFQVHCYHEPRSRFDPRGRVWGFEEKLLRWLKALPKPAGVFACNDIWGVQLSEACRQARLRVPEEVAMVGVDNDDLLCELARPSLSSVEVPAEDVGRQAAALLDEMLQGRAVAPHPVLLPPKGVVTRQSSDVLAIEDADVAAAVRFIRGNSHRPLAIDEVVEAVAICRRTLERKFRKALSRGLWDEVRRAHLERATRLLLDTDLSMSAVAAASAFNGGTHLSIVFRQELNTTPTAFRREGKSGVRSAALQKPVSVPTHSSGSPAAMTSPVTGARPAAFATCGPLARGGRTCPKVSGPATRRIAATSTHAGRSLGKTGGRRS